MKVYLVGGSRDGHIFEVPDNMTSLYVPRLSPHPDLSYNIGQDLEVEIDRYVIFPMQCHSGGPALQVGRLEDTCLDSASKEVWTRMVQGLLERSNHDSASS